MNGARDFSHKVSQRLETVVQHVDGWDTNFSCRYAYARFATRRNISQPGWDYLVFRHHTTRLAFALCDGVSASFMGGLAAQIVGDTLVNLLYDPRFPRGDQVSIEQTVARRLRDLTQEALHQVRAVELPEAKEKSSEDVILQPNNTHESSLVSGKSRLREQQKQGRDDADSQSMFAAGLIDTKGRQITLVWMGDSRIRLWGERGEDTISPPSDAFDKLDRWSTSRGPLGRIHTLTCALDTVRRIVVYSDGLKELNTIRDEMPNDNELQALINVSSSRDDVSFLDVEIKPARARLTSDTARPVSPTTHSSAHHISNQTEVPQPASGPSVGYQSRSSSYPRSSQSSVITLRNARRAVPGLATGRSARGQLRFSAIGILIVLTLPLLIVSAWPNPRSETLIARTTSTALTPTTGLSAARWLAIAPPTPAWAQSIAPDEEPTSTGRLADVVQMQIPTPPVSSSLTSDCYEGRPCVADVFRMFFKEKGAVEIFGYPITSLEDGKRYGTKQVQWFERSRMELDNNGLVRLGRLGDEALRQLNIDWIKFPRSDSSDLQCRLFPKTGYSICNAFLYFWNDHGGEQLFGLPLSEQMDDLDSSRCRIQWFERARFEICSTEETVFNVRLGLLGKELLSGPRRIDQMPR